MSDAPMPVFNSKEQTQAVAHIVLSLTLLVCGVFIFTYGLLEGSQLALYHTVSMNLVVSTVAVGLLLFVERFPQFNHPSLKLGMVTLGLAANVFGFWSGREVDWHIDTGVHPTLYLVHACALLLLASGQRWQLVQRFQLYFGAFFLSGSCAVFILHFLTQKPWLATHPMGSMVATLVTAIVSLALINSGWRSPSNRFVVAPRTLIVTTLSLMLLVSLSIATFHAEMNNLRQDGKVAAESFNHNRRVISEDTFRMLERISSRWQRYPENQQQALINADVRRQLNDIDYLQSLIFLNAKGQVLSEATRPQQPSQQYLLSDNLRLAQNILTPYQALDQPRAIFISEPDYTPSGMRVMVRMPIQLFAEGDDNSVESMIAVIDLPTMLGAKQSVAQSTVQTYIKYLDRYWVDQNGYWLSQNDLDDLRQNAIFLYTDELEGVTSFTLPVSAYVRDMSSIQRMSNLQSSIAVVGILLVFFLALTIERNLTLVRQSRQLRDQAERDSLTGLLNRTTFETMLAQKVGQQQQLSILFIDLDGFTLVNDSLGLQVGDRLLQLLAARLKSALGDKSRLARFSGDEFICLIEGTGDEQSFTELTQRILTTVAKPYRILQHKIYLTASIGVAHQSETNDSALELIQHADMAMHRAKRLGHNHVQVYEEEMSLQFHSSALMRSRLQEAIDAEALTLYYQPIVRCNDKQISGYEALLRWEHAPGQFVSPVDFIPLAEKTGQIIPLSEWVFREACAAAVELQKRGPYRIAVNLSTLHFNRSYFVDFVLATLAQTGCKPEWLELELTESILLDNYEYALAVLTKLRAHGIQIALDDFGTGFSSLSYLKRLPVDKVKIDRSFIAGIGIEKSDRVLIESVIRIAQSLDFAVVAEGVETKQQAQYVTELGCNFIQGYYFSRPLPFSAI